MNNLKIARAISVFVCFIGILVIIGWVFDIGVLKSVSPDWVTMKFTTAVSFVLSGVILYCLSLKESDLAQLILGLSSLLLLLIMATLLFSAFSGIQTGIDDLFVREAPGAVKTHIPGRPSVPTMVDFILIGAAALLAMQKMRRLLPPIGFIAALIGGIALIGYITGISALTFYLEGVNVPMAANTAALFILLGIGLMLLKNNHYAH